MGAKISRRGSYSLDKREKKNKSKKGKLAERAQSFISLSQAQIYEDALKSPEVADKHKSLDNVYENQYVNVNETKTKSGFSSKPSTDHGIYSTSSDEELYQNVFGEDAFDPEEQIERKVSSQKESEENSNGDQVKNRRTWNKPDEEYHSVMEKTYKSSISEISEENGEHIYINEDNWKDVLNGAFWDDKSAICNKAELGKHHIDVQEESEDQVVVDETSSLENLGNKAVQQNQGQIEVINYIPKKNQENDTSGPIHNKAQVDEHQMNIQEEGEDQVVVDEAPSLANLGNMVVLQNQDQTKVSTYIQGRDQEYDVPKRFSCVTNTGSKEIMQPQISTSESFQIGQQNYDTASYNLGKGDEINKYLFQESVPKFTTVMKDDFAVEKVGGITEPLFEAKLVEVNHPSNDQENYILRDINQDSKETVQAQAKTAEDVEIKQEKYHAENNTMVKEGKTDKHHFEEKEEIKTAEREDNLIQFPSEGSSNKIKTDAQTNGPKYNSNTDKEHKSYEYLHQIQDELKTTDDTQVEYYTSNKYPSEELKNNLHAQLNNEQSHIIPADSIEKLRDLLQEQQSFREGATNTLQEIAEDDEDVFGHAETPGYRKPAQKVTFEDMEEIGPQKNGNGSTLNIVGETKPTNVQKHKSLSKSSSTISDYYVAIDSLEEKGESEDEDLFYDAEEFEDKVEMYQDTKTKEQKKQDLPNNYFKDFEGISLKNPSILAGNDTQTYQNSDEYENVGILIDLDEDESMVVRHKSSAYQSESSDFDGNESQGFNRISFTEQIEIIEESENPYKIEDELQEPKYYSSELEEHQLKQTKFTDKKRRSFEEITVKAEVHTVSDLIPLEDDSNGKSESYKEIQELGQSSPIFVENSEDFGDNEKPPPKLAETGLKANIEDNKIKEITQDSQNLLFKDNVSVIISLARTQPTELGNSNNQKSSIILENPMEEHNLLKNEKIENHEKNENLMRDHNLSNREKVENHEKGEHNLKNREKTEDHGEDEKPMEDHNFSNGENIENDENSLGDHNLSNREKTENHGEDENRMENHNLSKRENIENDENSLGDHNLSNREKTEDHEKDKGQENKGNLSLKEINSEPWENNLNHPLPLIRLRSDKQSSQTSLDKEKSTQENKTQTSLNVTKQLLVPESLNPALPLNSDKSTNAFKTSSTLTTPEEIAEEQMRQWEEQKDAAIEAVIAEINKIMVSINELRIQIDNLESPDPNMYQALIKIMREVNGVNNPNFDERILKLQHSALNEVHACLRDLQLKK